MIDQRYCRLLTARALLVATPFVFGSAVALAQSGAEQDESDWQTSESADQDTGSDWQTSDATEQDSGATADEMAQMDQQTGQQQDQALEALAQQNEQLSTFVKALQEAGMADSLAEGRAYTVFAPTNEAFEASGRSVEELLQPENREELISLLRAHIVADDVDPEMASWLQEARTIDGGAVDIQASGEEIQVGDARVVESNIQQDNLRLYAIDQVLSPDAAASMAGAGESGAMGGETQDFAELDADGDGYLSEEELQQTEMSQAQLDSDNDGQVSESEFAAFEQDAQGEQMEQTEQDEWGADTEEGSAWDTEEQTDEQSEDW